MSLETILAHGETTGIEITDQGWLAGSSLSRYGIGTISAPQVVMVRTKMQRGKKSGVFREITLLRLTVTCAVVDIGRTRVLYLSGLAPKLSSMGMISKRYSSR